MTDDMSREVYPFRRSGRPVVLLTRREAQALQQVLDAVVPQKSSGDDETDLGRARRVLRLQLGWLDQTVLTS